MVLRIEMGALMAAHADLAHVAAVFLDRGVRGNLQHGIAGKAWLAVPHGMGEVDEFHVGDPSP